MLSRRTYTIIFALDLFVILSLLAYVITFFYLDTFSLPKTFVSAIPWFMPWMLWLIPGCFLLAAFVAWRFGEAFWNRDRATAPVREHRYLRGLSVFAGVLPYMSFMFWREEYHSDLHPGPDSGSECDVMGVEQSYEKDLAPLFKFRVEFRVEDAKHSVCFRYYETATELARKKSLASHGTASIYQRDFEPEGFGNWTEHERANVIAVFQDGEQLPLPTLSFPWSGRQLLRPDGPQAPRSKQFRFQPCEYGSSNRGALRPLPCPDRGVCHLVGRPRTTKAATEPPSASGLPSCARSPGSFGSRRGVPEFRLPATICPRRSATKTHTREGRRDILAHR